MRLKKTDAWSPFKHFVVFIVVFRTTISPAFFSSFLSQYKFKWNEFIWNGNIPNQLCVLKIVNLRMLFKLTICFYIFGKIFSVWNTHKNNKGWSTANCFFLQKYIENTLRWWHCTEWNQWVCTLSFAMQSPIWLFILLFRHFDS